MCDVSIQCFVCIYLLLIWRLNAETWGPKFMCNLKFYYVQMLTYVKYKLLPGYVVR